MIIVRNMAKSYHGSKVLSGISFQADPGEFIAIVGGSGSGKTTLLRLLALKEKWDQGQYIYKGEDVLELNAWDRFKVKQNMAYLPEKPVLNEQKSAVKNVVGGMIFRVPLWRRLIGKPTLDQHMLASDYLQKVGLLDKTDQKTGQLSGGEKQRVALARALVQGADVILADEPVTGLDPHSAERVLSDFRKICEEDEIILLCCLHDVSLAEKYATRIWGLADGKIMVDAKGRRLTLQEKRSIHLM